VEPGSSKHKKDISDTWCGITTLLLGSLVNNIQFRRGRAPSSITIGGAGHTSGIQGTAFRTQQNPFSGQMQQQFGKRIIHSDLFPGLGQGYGSRSVSQKTKQQSQSKFPRGVRL